ncbi:MAG: hypothetical protein DRO15_04275 [Thermoprotei archaeon]|nr:MAG: hypothetical protein DRO15_04275 [Thermoprotei archaeon]
MLISIVQALVNGVLIGCIYALIAIGLQMIYGVLGIINLAHGDFLMLAMLIAYSFAYMTGMDVTLTFLLTFPLLFIIGAGVYLSVINPLIKRKPLFQFAMTLGLSFFLPSIAQVVWGTEPKASPSTILSGVIHMGGISITYSYLTAGLVGVLAIIALYIFMNRTYLGLAIRAVPDNKDAAALMGVNIKMIYCISFALGIALLALPGSLLMAFQNAYPTIGTRYNLLAWCVVVLAGLGSFSGLLVSGLIVGIIESLIASLWDPRATPLGIYLVFLLILWLKPKGLFGRG